MFHKILINVYLFHKTANTVVLIFAIMYSDDNLGRELFLLFTVVVVSGTLNEGSSGKNSYKC